MTSTNRKDFKFPSDIIKTGGYLVPNAKSLVKRRFEMISKGCESLIKRSFSNEKACSIIASLSTLHAHQIEDPEIDRVNESSFNPRVCRLIEIALNHLSMRDLDKLISISQHTSRELLSTPLEPELAAVCFLDTVRHLHMSKTLSKKEVLEKFSEAVNSLSHIRNKTFFEQNLRRYKEKYT